MRCAVTGRKRRQRAGETQTAEQRDSKFFSFSARFLCRHGVGDDRPCMHCHAADCLEDNLVLYVARRRPQRRRGRAKNGAAREAFVCMHARPLPQPSRQHRCVSRASLSSVTLRCARPPAQQTAAVFSPLLYRFACFQAEEAQWQWRWQCRASIDWDWLCSLHLSPPAPIEDEHAARCALPAADVACGAQPRRRPCAAGVLLIGSRGKKKKSLAFSLSFFRFLSLPLLLCACSVS